MSEAAVATEQGTRVGTVPAPQRGAFLHGAPAAAPRRDSLRRRMLAGADVLALLGAYAAVWAALPPPDAWWTDLPLAAALPLWVVLNKTLGLYDRDVALVHHSTLDELPKILHSISLGAALALLLGPLLPGVAMHRPQVLLWWLAAMTLTPALRAGARHLVRRHTRPERVAIVGSGFVASTVARKLAAHPEYGADLVGFIDIAGEPGTADELPRLGDADEFAALAQEHRIERVVIAFSSLTHEPLLDIVRIATRLRLKVSVVPRLFEVIGRGVELDQVEGMTLLGMRGLTRTKSTLALKRALDVAGAVAGLVAAAPFLALAAVAIRLDSPGAVVFGQRRRGRHQREFTMWKLRTMVDGADALKPSLLHLNEMSGGPMFKIADDPRVTRVGRFLRRTSLDEVPQLWNVLRGDMSLVGPRPLVPAEDDHVIGWHRARLDLTPGLTGPWQVMGRNAIPFDEMVRIDYLYVAEWSLWNDLKLVLRTLPVVAGRRGS